MYCAIDHVAKRTLRREEYLQLAANAVGGCHVGYGGTWGPVSARPGTVQIWNVESGDNLRISSEVGPFTRCVPFRQPSSDFHIA